MEAEFIYYARLEYVSKLDESEFAGSRTIGILGSNYRGRRLGRSTIFMQSRIYGWRARYRRVVVLRSFILPRVEAAAGGCCQWQHLVKGRKRRRGERGEILRGELGKEKRDGGSRWKEEDEREKEAAKKEKDGDGVTGGCKRSTGHRRRTTIQPHHP